MPKDAKGGSEIQACLIGQELLRRGWEVHYIRENNQMVGQEERIQGIIVHSLPQRHTKLKWANTRRLSRLMKKIKAEVWYCRATGSYVFPVSLNAKKIGGKVIWACSSDRFLAKNSVKEWKKESLLRRTASLIDRFLLKRSMGKVDLIILQNHGQKRLLAENWGLKGEVIYNSHPIFPLKKAEREPLILWIGRLQPWKHPEGFTQLVRGLKEKPYKFLALGRKVEDFGYDEDFLKMEKEVANFSYLGERSREDVFQLLEKAKVLVNTSRVEGFSNTFIEAWLHGVPVVTLNVDPDELIEKNSLGSVSRNSDKLIKDVELLMENEELWRQTSRRCRKFAEENFNIIDKVNDLEGLIERLE